jgi:hypothetical protein
MAKLVLRSLNYAWIEYGHPGDAKSFDAGAKRLGWTNLFSKLPRQADKFGSRYVDHAHPMLPIRYVGTALLARPNDRVDSLTSPIVDDPIFKDYIASHGEEAWRRAIIDQNTFLAQWAFSPGLKTSGTGATVKAELVAEPGAPEYAHWVIVSGHGTNGEVWGGGNSCPLAAELANSVDHGDGLQYVILPCCYNLSDYAAVTFWKPAFDRTYPIRGILGYQEGYPGGAPGATLFATFVQQLKAGLTVLDAWRKAHKTAMGGAYRHRWAAMLHSGVAADTAAKLAETSLTAPKPGDPVRFYNEANYPAGQELVERIPRYYCDFWVGPTKVTKTNCSQASVGLRAGDTGYIEFIDNRGTGGFAVGEYFMLVFYLFRPLRDGMDIEKLLTVTAAQGCTCTLVDDANKENGTTFKEGIQLVINQQNASSVKINFKVRADALTHYTRQGANNHGCFFIGVYEGPGTEVYGGFVERSCGIFLRE